MRVMGIFAAAFLAAHVASAAKAGRAGAPAARADARPAEPAGPKPWRIGLGLLNDETGLAEDELQALQQAVASVMGAATARAAAAGAAAVDVVVDGKVQSTPDGARSLSLLLYKAPDGAALAHVERRLPAELPLPAALRAGEELLARAAQLEVCELGVTSEPSGATVLLDAQPVGVTPLARTYVLAGEHRLRVEKDEFVAVDRTLEFAAGEVRDEAVQLEDDPAVVARRALERVRTEAEHKARVDARLQAEADARRKLEEERARLEAFESEARAQAARHRQEEDARRAVEASRKDLFAALLRLGAAVPSAASRAGLDALGLGGGDRLVFGGSLRAPVYRNHWVALDVDYWRDHYWPEAPPTGTPRLVRVLPVGMVALGVSGGRRERFGSLVFVDGSLSLGARLTRYARHQEFLGGEPLDELEKVWKPSAGLGLGAGVAWNRVEASLTWKLTVPLGAEPAADHKGADASLGGFGLVNVFGLQLGAVY